MSETMFARQVEVFLDQDMSPEEMSRHLAAVAKAGVQELISTGRASPIFTRYVDGKKDAPEEAVEPSGTIAYEFEYLGEIVVFALGFLRQRAPVASGRYISSFYVGVGGKFVKAENFRPDIVPPGMEIIIGNTQPYSRKIDVQLVGNQRLRFSEPPNLFLDAAVAVRRRFGNFVSAKRIYTVEFPGQYILRTGRRRGKRVESPALVLAAL